MFQVRSSVHFSKQCKQGEESRVPGEGLTVTTGEGQYHSCNYCEKISNDCNIKLHTCSKCKVCYYCSKDCQQKVWKTHKELCNAITFLGQQASCKTDASNVLMLPKDKSKMARLIGEKCMINCFVNSSLLDTWYL